MDCSSDNNMATACSVDEAILPSLMSSLGAASEDGDTDDIHINNNINNDDHGNIRRSIERGPIQQSPTPDTEEGSLMDYFSTSTAMKNALSIYDETSDTFNRIRAQALPSRLPSFMTAISSNDGSDNMSRTRIRSGDQRGGNHYRSVFRTTSPSKGSPKESDGTPSVTKAQPHSSPSYDLPSKKSLSQRSQLRELRPTSPPEPETLIKRSGSFHSRHSEAGSTHKILVTRSYEVKEHVLESIFYVSTSAVLGSVVRTYLARLFGYDCATNSVNDFLTPLSSKICVTNGGRTLQTGGALFYDFPANVLGSLIMGIITPRPEQRRARLPWLHRDHPLQRDDVFHASLATGFCGCLTTYASWNTQMVAMLDGTYCELGSQVVTVLFGYVIGLMGATCGFHFGRQCGLWMYNLRHSEEGNRDTITTVEDEMEGAMPLYREPRTHSHYGIELVDDDEVKLKPVPSHLHKIPLFLAAIALLVGFLIGDIVQGIQFYRGMTLLWCLSPIGSLLRWRLSGLNTKEGKLWCITLPAWVPWGTFCANVLGSTIGACLTGLNDRYFSEADPMERNWVRGLIFALNIGFSGSLSTVSTMIKETVILSEQHPGLAKPHYYAIGSCCCTMFLGLVIYATTVRIGST